MVAQIGCRDTPNQPNGQNKKSGSQSEANLRSIGMHVLMPDYTSIKFIIANAMRPSGRLSSAHSSATNQIHICQYNMNIGPLSYMSQCDVKYMQAITF